jgi:molybdate transport system substrate-binding protein
LKRLHLLYLSIPLLVLVLTTFTAGDRSPGRELTVFAASSLTNALDEISTAFEAEYPGVRIIRNYAASSQLASQIPEGAPADVFASANVEQMQHLVDGGYINGAVKLFASNRLTVIVPADNPGNIERLADLAEPGVILVLAVPGVPVRNYTDQFVSLVEADPDYGYLFSKGFYANVVSEEDNVRRVVAKVALGEADAGVVYTSDVTPDIFNDIRQIPIANEFNVLATYPIGLINNSQESDLAQAFIDYILSDEGQSILGEWGFGSKP